jgi:CRP/FNR family transcriptional regulator
MQDIAHKVLSEYSFYREGSSELRKGLLEHVRLFDKKNLKGGHLFRVGDRSDSICLVGSGNIRVYVSGISGRGVLLYNVRAGEICPINMRMVVARSVALAHADASTDLVAVVLNREGVRDLSARFSEFHQFVQQSVADRFEEIILRISDITTRSVDHRLIDLLLEEFDSSESVRPTVEMTRALKLGRGRIWLEDRAVLQALKKPKQPVDTLPG